MIPNDEILDFSIGDKIRLIDFNGDFSDLTFEVDQDAGTITIGISGPALSFAYVRDDRKVVLRNAADLIDENGNHLLTAENFHLVKHADFTALKYSVGLRRSVEPVAASEGDDVLVGGYSLHGREGDDILYGSTAADTLRGGKGLDVLDGYLGNDVLYGGQGDDFLDGNWGDDTLYGSRGDDTFVFYERGGKDTIVDFTSPSPVSIEALTRHFRAHLVEQGLSEDAIERYVAERESSRTVSNDVIKLHLKVPADTSDEAAFEALTIRQDGDDTVIGYGSKGDTITLEDVSAPSLTMDDFDFVFIG